MRFALIGTGFVADYYMTTLANYPNMELAGCFDVNTARLQQFCAFHSVSAYTSLDAALADETIETVAVLTTPESHYAVCRAALEAGKHVYCEKPLAMSVDEATALVALAAQKGLVLGGAPANAYSQAFDLTQSALAGGEIGVPKLVYAEMEDGPVFRDNWQQWRSASGAPWPGQHEFELGCTLEHAGYGLSWLIGLFGSIHHISGYSGTFFLDKGVPIAPDAMAPDFSSAILTFENGVIARLTCGLCAPRDRALTIMGERGTITVADLWDDRSAVFMQTPDAQPPLGFRVMRRLEEKLSRVLPIRLNAGKRLRYGTPKRKNLPRYPSQIDFCAGLEAVSQAVQDADLRERLGRRALHITEAALVINRISDHDDRYTMTSTL